MTGRLLSICAALALGELAGLSIGTLAALWPVALTLAALIALIGYGRNVRHWPLAFALFLGLTLAMASTNEHEKNYRHKFWLRNSSSRTYSRNNTPSPFPHVKAELARRLTIGLPDDSLSAGLNRALLLGERNGLPRGMRKAFVDAGTIHVFAISGLHVMLVANVLIVILAIFGFSWRVSGSVAMIPLWGYVVTIGSPPSAVRAATMASLYWLAPLFYRRPNAIRAWALTFLIVHVLAPENLTNAGSALSFAVMLGILLWIEVTKNLAPKWLFGSFGVSLSAWLAGVPIAAHVFGRITPGGLFANLVLMPTVEWSVTFGTLGVAASFVSERLAAHLNNLSALLTEAMAGLSAAVSTLPGANFQVCRWSYPVCAEWYIAFALVLWLLYRHSTRRKVL